MKRADVSVSLGLTIRYLRSDDSLDALTGLLHRAYRPLAEARMRFLATHQSIEVTRSRCTGPGKECLVAELNGAIVGTITLGGPEIASTCRHYREPDACIANQLAVEPDLQGRRIARRLMLALEGRARERGFRRLMGDTSEHATRLLETYARWGFQPVGRTRWPEVNCQSIVCAKGL